MVLVITLEGLEGLVQLVGNIPLNLTNSLALDWVSKSRRSASLAEFALLTSAAHGCGHVHHAQTLPYRLSLEVIRESISNNNAVKG